MSWRDILASLTTNPATFFKVPNGGQITEGVDADLVVLAADPANDPRNFANVVLTIRGGRIIYDRR